MFDQAYETKAAGFYTSLLGNIFNQVQRAEISDRSSFKMTKVDSTGIDPDDEWIFMLVNNSHREVPQFAHPIVTLNGAMGKNLILTNVKDHEITVRRILIDSRPFISGNDSDQRIKPRSDFGNIQVLRGLLQYQWMVNPRTDFMGVGDIAIRVYTYWISGVINRALSLDPQTLFDLNKIISMRYMLYFYKFQGREIDEATKLIIVRRAAQALRFSEVEGIEMLDQVGDSFTNESDMSNFIEVMVKATGSDRIKEQINVPKLIQLIGGTWMGTNAKENAAVAMEHIPTFYTLLFIAATDRGLRKTQLGRTVETLSKPVELQQYIRAIRMLSKI